MFVIDTSKYLNSQRYRNCIFIFYEYTVLLIGKKKVQESWIRTKKVEGERERREGSEEKCMLIKTIKNKT